MYRKKGDYEIAVYGEGYLVKSIYSDKYTSYNTLDYYKKLLHAEKPWYYEFYEYKWSNNPSINRSELKGYDRQLFKLHLRAMRVWKEYKTFYWLVDDNLNKQFEYFWLEQI